MTGQNSSTEIRFRLKEGDVIFESFDAEVVAIQLATGAYHSISGSGIDAFLLLSSEPTIAELAEALAAKYDASSDRIAEDIESFLEKLQKEALVVARPAENGNGHTRAASHSGSRLAYVPPVFQAYHDLQNLLFIDPVHEVGPAGWPKAKAEMAPDQEARYQSASPSATIFERFDDETVAINLGSGAYYSFSGAAEDVFLLLAEEPTHAEIVQALRGKYMASEQEISGAVAQFLPALMLAGLAGVAPAALEPLPARQLALAKPGRDLPFEGLELASHSDPVAAPLSLRGSLDRSSIAFARKRFRVPESGLTFRTAGQETVVIDFNKGEYYLLNSSATAVYRLLEQQPTASELIDSLTRLYDLSSRELTAAVLILLRTLMQEGLVAAGDAGEQSGRRLELTGLVKPERYEAFSVEAFREMRGLFLPFPGARSERGTPAHDARELVSQLAEYHRQSARRGGLTEAAFHVAGETVRMRLAGGMQNPGLGLAFEHLSNGVPHSTANEFTIQVWDAGSAGPPEDSSLAGFLNDFFSRWYSECGPRGEVLAFHSEKLPVLYHAGPDILSVIDPETRTAYYLKRDQSPLPYWEIASPFRTILHYWFSLRGLQFVHAGAVGTGEGGVILAGRGGSGKSSTTLACVDAGMDYAGDDYCLLEQQTTPYLHSLYNSAKLKSQHDFARFPHLKEHVWNRECLNSENGDKATFFLSQIWPQKMSRGFPLRAVLVPQVTGRRDTELGECSEAQALLALSASTVAQLPMAGSDDLQRLGDVVAKLPRYVLYLGTDLTQIPAVIRTLL